MAIDIKELYNIEKQKEIENSIALIKERISKLRSRQERLLLKNEEIRSNRFKILEKTIRIKAEFL